MSAVSDTTEEAAKKSPLSLPMLLEPKEAVDWKLPSWNHVKWTMHALAPIFGLSLDSLPSISNAVKIYCLWLKAPSLRPSCITEENELQFVSVLFSFSRIQFSYFSNFRLFFWTCQNCSLPES